MLEVKQISKMFKSYQALKNVTFSVKPGEIVGFLGVNGAGKTTTMRIITGFLFPSAGDVTINDNSITLKTQIAQREIGYLAESNPLYPDMVVWRFLEWIRNIKEASTDNVADIVDHLELRNVLNKKIGHLSKGFKQRVGLAQAMIGNPSLLVLDEPTSGLDPVQKEQILAFIKSFSSQQHAVLFSSHILSEVSEIADRVVIIDNGEIKAQGTPESLAGGSSADSTYTVVIRTKAALANVEKALQSLKQKVTLKAEQKTGVHTVKATIARKAKQSADQLLEQVSQALVSHRVGILGLEIQKSDIKDLFTRLTQQK